jgi:hypothetical protein
MCCNEAPDAPDYDAMAKASEESARFAYKASQDQLQWARDQWGDQKRLLDKTLGVQTGIMQEQWDQAKTDRSRYESIYQPLEDNLTKEFQTYASPERIDLERGRAQAAVQQSFDAQRQNATRQLEQYGIDPSQTRSQALDRNARVQLVAQQAGQSNQAQARTEAVGRALRTEALNIGRGYPSQVAGSYSGAIQAGNSAVGNSNATVGSGVGSMGTGQGWAGVGQAGTMNQANITNMGFQNQLSAFDARQSSGAMAGIGQLAGVGLGVAGAMSFEDGGHVRTDGSPTPGPSDTVPALLAPDEFVIPEDVVRRKGTEFFDKLIAKVQQEAAGVPAGGGNGGV